MCRIFRTLIGVLPLTIAMLGCQPAQTTPTPAATAPPIATATPLVTPSSVPPSATANPAIPATQVMPTGVAHLPTWTIAEPASPQPAMEIGVTKDVSYTSKELLLYGNYTSKKLLDVYAPRTQGKWPVVVAFHGGDEFKSSMSDLAQAIAERGAVVFAPTYYAHEPTIPLAVPIAQSAEDTACAVRFARAHAVEYGGHADRVIVVGHSYGGTMGALLMLAGDEFHGDCLTQEGSALPDALVGLDGVYDLIPLISDSVLKAEPAECLRNNPFTYVGRTPRRENISFRLFVGSTYELRVQGQAFRDALQAVGYNVDLFQTPGADHNAMVKPWPATVDAIAALLRP